MWINPNRYRISVFFGYFEHLEIRKHKDIWSFRVILLFLQQIRILNRSNTYIIYVLVIHQSIMTRIVVFDWFFPYVLSRIGKKLIFSFQNTNNRCFSCLDIHIQTRGQSVFLRACLWLLFFIHFPFSSAFRLHLF